MIYKRERQLKLFLTFAVFASEQFPVVSTARLLWRGRLRLAGRLIGTSAG